MLKFFPTPYPDEWWYSILCRYHVYSGNITSQTTIRELFENHITAQIGSLFPSGMIHQVLKQLPPNFIERDVLLQNTLAPYLTRFFSYRKKETVIQKLCEGERQIIVNYKRFFALSQGKPRCCPVCIESDRKKYGEAYWHMTHQIPLMTICPKHHCQLQTIDSINSSHLNHTFFPLDAQETRPAKTPDSPSWYTEFLQILYEYQTIPFDISVTPNHNNLAVALANMGYEALYAHSDSILLDVKRLYRDLISVYGSDFVQRIIGDEKSIGHINRIAKWEVMAPERYALLQHFTGISTETLFHPEAIENQLKNKFLSLVNSNIPYGPKQFKEIFGITRNQLNILLRKYDISPKWRKLYDDKQHRHNLHIFFNDEDYAIFRTALKKSGIRFGTTFARYCIMEYIKKYMK